MFIEEPQCLRANSKNTRNMSVMKPVNPNIIRKSNHILQRDKSDPTLFDYVPQTIHPNLREVDS